MVEQLDIYFIYTPTSVPRQEQVRCFSQEFAQLFFFKKKI